ncbi:MAG: type II toxin-antitoxin system RelE/ParE family toxin [Nanoarchaeota archaeon]
MLHIELGNPAKRFLRKCESELYQRLIKKIESLAVEPFPHDLKRVVGKKEKVFRVRVGDYRIQYVVFYEQNTILIADVDKRSKAYD